jgi:telomere length regulation protein
MPASCVTEQQRLFPRLHRSVFIQPFLFAHFLKTLALIFSAAGPATVSIHALTVELWSLLLYVRGMALEAAPVLEALLFSFLTILEINNDQDLVNYAKELLETQAWVQQVFDNLPGGSEEGERARTLAAGCLVRMAEVIEKHQRALMGAAASFA